MSVAATSEREVEAIYQPFRVAAAALAPDGRHVAFVVRERGVLEARVYAIGDSQVKARVPIDERRGAAPALVAWADAERLVVATDSPLVRVFEASGGNNRVLVDGRTFVGRDELAPRLRILGLVAEPTPTLLLELVRPHPPEQEVTLELARVEVLTGAKEATTQAVLGLPGGSLLVDRQGRPRFLFSEEDVPQRWRYREATGPERWAALPGAWGTLATTFDVTPENFLGERSMPLGLAEEGERLYFASNVGRDTSGVYELDLRSGRQTTVFEDAERDLAGLVAPWKRPPLVFDRARRKLVGIRQEEGEAGTHWIDAELSAIQAQAGRKFPERTVQLLEWDDARETFLALVSSPSDPGRYFVHHRKDGRWVEYLRRATNLPAEKLNRVEAFAVSGPDGARVSGQVTLPHAPAVARPPLLIWLHDGLWQHATPGFNRDAQALAAMGFVVVQLDYRGSAGRGRAHREAVRGAWDVGPLADVERVVAWLEKQDVFDRRRVALVGEGFGGYIALRALQRHPEAYRAAAAINAPVELGDLRRSLTREEKFAAQNDRELWSRIVAPATTPIEREVAMDARMTAAMNAPPEQVDFEHAWRRWFFGDAARLAEVSVLRQAERITRPVMLLHDPRHRPMPIGSVQELRRTLERRKHPVAFGEISSQFARGEPSVRAQVVRRVGEFLNVTLYDFDVKIGEATEKEGK